MKKNCPVSAPPVFATSLVSPTRNQEGHDQYDDDIGDDPPGDHVATATQTTNVTPDKPSAKAPRRSVKRDPHVAFIRLTLSIAVRCMLLFGGLFR